MTQIRAEMVANVTAVTVEVGQPVAEGDTLLLVESMKMEIPITATTGGEVHEINVAPGDVVHEGDVLVVLGS